MKWQEIAVTTKTECIEAVAEAFHQVGAGGVVIEDPRLVTEYIGGGQWDCHEVTSPELGEDQAVVKAYLPVDSQLEEKMSLLSQRLREIQEIWGLEAMGLMVTQVEEQDWAHAWKAYFKPEKVGEKIVIRPTWEEYQPLEGELVIAMDPGMAFGTGTHPTTVLCLRALEKMVRGGELVYDVGTGSGVLAIAAAKLGAARVTAVDLDPVAVKVAAENVVVNGVEQRVQVQEGNLLELAKNRAHGIVANIIADVILSLIPQAWALLRPGGWMVASGIIQDRLDEVVEGFNAQGFKVQEMASEGDWVAVIATRPGVSWSRG